MSIDYISLIQNYINSDQTNIASINYEPAERSIGNNNQWKLIAKFKSSKNDIYNFIGIGQTIQSAKHAAAKSIWESFQKTINDTNAINHNTNPFTSFAIHSNITDSVNNKDNNNDNNNKKNNNDNNDNINTTTATTTTTNNNNNNNTATDTHTNKYLEIIEIELLAAGRSQITAKELMKQLMLKRSITIPKSTVNKCLYILKNKNLAEKNHIKIGEYETVFWAHKQLEPTSINEVENLIDLLNNDINLNKPIIKPTQLVPDPIHPIQFKLNLEENKFETTDGLRIDSKIILSGENPDYEIITSNSGPKLESIEANIYANHKLLKILSGLPNNRLDSEYRKRCLKAYNNAYFRGRLFTTQQLYHLSEGIYIEFKCCSIEQPLKQWTEKLFLKSFKLHTRNTICAFINSYLCNIANKPLIPAQIIFGVHDGSRIIHGVWYQIRDSKFDIIAESDKLQNIIRETIKERIIDKPTGWALKLASSITVKLIELKSINSNDSFYDHKSHCLVCSNPSYETVLIIVELDFDSENIEIIYPCLVKLKKDGIESIAKKNNNLSPEAELYIRTHTPSTISTDNKEYFNLLFPYGIPTELIPKYIINNTSSIATVSTNCDTNLDKL